jgi:DNA-binding protein H-NS
MTLSQNTRNLQRDLKTISKLLAAKKITLHELLNEQTDFCPDAKRCVQAIFSTITADAAWAGKDSSFAAVEAEVVETLINIKFI